MRPTVRRTLSSLFALSTIFLAACSDSAAPAEPTMRPPSKPTMSISDAAHDGNAGFYFLAPLVAQPPKTGTFDATRSVSVTVCPLGVRAAAACTGSPVRVSPVEVDVNGNHYHANWKTDDVVFPSDAYYRVSVIDNATGYEFGHVDVFLGSTGRGFHTIDQDQFTPLLDGRTVPVKFRLDAGARPTMPPPVDECPGCSVG
jgi:hypothetical protein